MNCCAKKPVFSISKYNDRRALDILDRALEKNRNKRLYEPIARAIERIKSNSPFLAMLPSFMLGSKNRELFQITLKVFKKILGPADAKGFIAYLHHGDQMVSEGSFEILCFRGDAAVFYFIAEFFREQSRLLLRETDQQTGVERLLTLIASLHEYLRRYRDFFPQLRPDIAAMLSRAGGCEWENRWPTWLPTWEQTAGGHDGPICEISKEFEHGCYQKSLRGKKSGI